MHRARIVRKQQTAPPQFVDKLIEGGLPDPVHAMIADRCRDLFACRRVVFRPEQNPLRRRLRRDFCRCLSKSLRQPSLCRTIFRTWAKTKFRRLIVGSGYLIASWMFGIGRRAFDVCCFCPAFAGDSKKTERMMLGRAGLSRLADGLVHKPAPPMPS